MLWKVYKITREKLTFKRLLPSVVDESFRCTKFTIWIIATSLSRNGQTDSHNEIKWFCMSFDLMSVIALKRCPILKSALQCIIICCWQNRIIPETWKRGFCVLTHLQKRFTKTTIKLQTYHTRACLCEGAHIIDAKLHV